MAKKTKQIETREQWLRAGMVELNKILERQGDGAIEDLDMIQVSVGYAKGKPKAIGQCFGPSWTGQEGVQAIFICPTLTAEQPVRILDVLLHEMIHAKVGCEHGHKKPFVDLARKVGLKGKPTATFAEEETELFAALEKIADKLGEYPHVQMKGKVGPTKPPAGGWIKFFSENDEEYILRISPKSLENHGAPRDFAGDEMIMEVAAWMGPDILRAFAGEVNRAAAHEGGE